MEMTVGQAAISVLQFVAVAMFVWAVFRIRLTPEPPVNRRIAMALGVGSRDTVFETPGLQSVMAVFLGLARRFPLGRDRIRQDLEASGNPSGYSVEEYLALCLACAAGMAAVGVFTAGMFGVFGGVVAVGLIFVGFYAPLFVLRESAEKRTTAIAKQIPYTLDLIALTMESGATFTEAVDTMIQDEPNDPLNQELGLVRSEIDMGSSRSGALRNLAGRVPLESLRGVVGAINQSESLGTPLSTILKNQASMLRHIRSVRAEEAAAKASLKILVPSMLILGAVLLVLFSPFIVQMIEGEGMFVP